MVLHGCALWHAVMQTSRKIAFDVSHSAYHCKFDVGAFNCIEDQRSYV